MAGRLEKEVVDLVGQILGGRIDPTPSWLVRPGRAECGRHWPLICLIYQELTGLELPETMRPIERRKVDAVLVADNGPPRILEFDEKQHFNLYRAETLRFYADEIPLAFDHTAWIECSRAKRRLEGGGFAAPKPPLFPGEGGRHRQRAFRDALCDILPVEHGFAPTLRIADFEVKDWIGTPAARSKMEELLQVRVARGAGFKLRHSP